MRLELGVRVDNIDANARLSNCSDEFIPCGLCSLGPVAQHFEKCNLDGSETVDPSLNGAAHELHARQCSRGTTRNRIGVNGGNLGRETEDTSGSHSGRTTTSASEGETEL
jgi:hypothetical protein